VLQLDTRVYWECFVARPRARQTLIARNVVAPPVTDSLLRYDFRGASALEERISSFGTIIIGPAPALGARKSARSKEEWRKKEAIASCFFFWNYDIIAAHRRDAGLCRPSELRSAPRGVLPAETPRDDARAHASIARLATEHPRVR